MYGNRLYLFLAVFCLLSFSLEKAHAEPQASPAKAAQTSSAQKKSPSGAAKSNSTNPLEMESESERIVRWDLVADDLVSFNDAEILEAKGNVVLTRGTETLKADFARYYLSTKWVYLHGNVEVFNGKDELTASEAEFDLRSRVGWLKEGRIFLEGPHTYVSGQHVSKHWGDLYTFKNATLTTCDGDSPAWGLAAKEAVVEVDGYARLTSPSFQIKNTSVLAAPYFIVPVKTSRQTGFLIPTFGKSNTKGTYYNQPFFWAVSESVDVTFNEQFMDRRGLMHGVEFRARPSSDSMVWLRGDMLWDKIRDFHDTGAYSGDGLIRKNERRYWVRGMVDTRLPDPAWRFKADIDYVSDQYFLSEFKSDFGGYNRSRKELKSWFNRDLQEKDLKRVSGFLLTRDWSRFSRALSSTYSQDQTLGNGNRRYRDDETVQHVPQLDAFLHKGRFFEALPLEFEASAQAGYKYRRKGTRGARYEVIPRVTLPFNTRYGSIIASAGLYQTLYDTELPSSTVYEPWENRDRQDKKWRTIPEFNIAAFTEFARVFSLNYKPLPLANSSLGATRWSALLHSVQPRVEFRQRANINQDDYPRYSSDDRLLPKTELAYSVTNIFTVQREGVSVIKDETTGMLVPTRTTSLKEVGRLRLEQSYDFREATRTAEHDVYSRRPYSDILAEVTISPWDNISLTTKNYWSPYKGDLTRHESTVYFNFPGYGTLGLGYDMRKAILEYTRKQYNDISYIRASVSTNQIGPFSLYASYEQDYEDYSNREVDITLVYNHQCFKLFGTVSIEPQEETYQLSIELTGLGD